VQGRWLSPDPSGLAAVNPAQSWNRYAYVGNRPLNTRWICWVSIRCACSLMTPTLIAGTAGAGVEAVGNLL
jgi:hypothetical protein